MGKKNNFGGGIFPFGYQNQPGDNPRGSAFGSLFYSMGMPGLYGGRWTSVYQDQFNKRLMNGQNPNEGMPWNAGSQGGNSQKPPQQPVEPAGIEWTFPQYSQSWAFTPPPSTPYTMPPPFKPQPIRKPK